jgi:hypothetical protein
MNADEQKALKAVEDAQRRLEQATLDAFLENFLSTAEVARELGVKPQSVQTYYKSGILSSRVELNARDMYYAKSVVLAAKAQLQQIHGEDTPPTRGRPKRKTR